MYTVFRLPNANPVPTLAPPSMSGEREYFELLESDSDTSVLLGGEKPLSRTRGLSSLKRRVILALTIVLLVTAIVLFGVDIGLRSRPKTTQVPNPEPEGFLTSHLWPIGLPNKTDNWENENSKSMHALFACSTAGTCTENQTSIVLLSSNHFPGAISGRTSGEDIWAASVILALRELGYTAIFSPDNYELARTYRQYPDLVKIIILEASRAKDCFKDSKCIKTPTHPLGVPAWKLLSFHFWSSADNPLGNEWTLSPEAYDPSADGKSNTYLGYSIERTCRDIPVTPVDDRPLQGYVFGKQHKYFGPPSFTWKNVSFTPPPESNLGDFSLVAGFNPDRKLKDVSIPKGITNLGILTQTQFYEQIGKSRVLVGIGNPALSPSPYDALCMGVPFINPIMDWDKKNPEDRTKWNTQHNGLRNEHPPYVYHVRKGDGNGLWEAIGEAVRHPIGRYIVPAMSMDSLKQRVGWIVERDWKAMAEVILQERKATGKGALFEI